MQKLKFFLSLLMLFTFSMGTWATEVLQATLDFTTDEAWQIGSTEKTASESFSDGTYTITLAATNAYKMNSGYLILGKSGSTLTLPAFSWKTSKIVVTGRSGASGSTKMNVFVGSTEVSTETTGSTGTNTYVINSSYQAAGNVYVLKVTSNHNAQITKIEIYADVETTTPSISVEQGGSAITEIDFGSVMEDTETEGYGYSSIQAIDVKGENLTGNVYLEIAIDDSGTFDIWDPRYASPAQDYITLVPTAGVLDTTIVVTAYTKSTGFKWGTLNVSSLAFTPDFAAFDIDLSVNLYAIAPGEKTISLNNTFFGCATGNNAAEQNKSQEGVTVVAGCSSGAQTKTYYDGAHVRFYADSYLKFSVPSGYVITSIVFTAGGTWNGGISANVGDYVADTKTWTGSANEVDFSFTAQDRIATAVVTFAVAPSIGLPTISGQTPFYPSTTVTMSIETDGADIIYTLDGSDPTGGDNTYTEPLVLSETTTVKARGFKGVQLGDIVSKTFTKATVLSVAEARTLIDGGVGLDNQFVEGYIYRVESYNSTYHSLTYWLTADGQKGDSLEVYSGKGLNSADFSSISDLSVGDKVVVCGTLKKFNDIYYEFDKNNYLVSRVEKGDVTALVVSGSATTTSYDPGTKLSMDGLTATATYANGFQADVTEDATWSATPQFMGLSVTSFDATATYQSVASAAYPVAVTLLKYAVTFSQPAHGTLVVRRYSTAIESGDEFPKNTDLTVEATPDDGYQLATLTAGGVDIKSTKAFTMGTEDIAVVATFEEIPHVYSVVGVASVIPVGWDPEATATEMTLNEGVYSYKVENVVLAAGTNYEWKIVEDHAWTVSYPQEGNASFLVDKNGRYDVTFTLNKSTKAYAATPELLEEIAVNRTFAVLGDFNSWSATAEEGAPDVATLSFTVNIDATGDYEFKLKVNDAWLANGYTYHRNYTGAADITANGSNMTLQVDQVGEYTFTWTFATNAMEITFPALKANPELSWNGIDEYNRAWAYREGKPFDFPTLVKPDGVSVTYSSDDGGTIITINETTGAITLLSEGVAHITATSAANDTYNAGTATYTLYVCGPTSIALGGAAEKLTYEYGDPFDRTGLTATLSFNNGGGTYDVTDVATWTYDKETITSGGSVHVTVSYVGQEDEKYVYNVKVATHAVTWTQPAVGGTFEVLDNTSNPFSSGTTFRKGIEITVVPSAAPNYELATLTANGADIKSTKKYTIGTEDVVIAATFVKVPVAAGLEWSTSNAYVRKGSALNEFPTLSNPNGIEGITYESTDESIATIHASTGAISLLANGETTLKAIFAGNDDYLAQTVECTLHVAAGIVTITPAAPVALELGNVPFGSTRADYGQSFHLNITNLISGQYNQVKIDFTGSAFWTAGNNYITDNDQDGVIDVDVTIVPSEYWWSQSEANALGEQNTTITLMCTGSAQFEDVVVGTATMNVVASIPTGIDNAEAQEKAQKMIKDGMLVIIKNGQEFNVFGEKIK